MVADELLAAIYPNAKSGVVERLERETHLADSYEIYVIDGAYVAYVSPPEFPDAARKRAAAIRRMQTALGAAADVLPEIVSEGQADGKTFLVVPKYIPLRTGRIGRRVDAFRVRRRVMDWVYAVASKAETPDETAAKAFESRLQTLKDLPGIPRHIADACRQSLRYLGIARHLPMHGDLWTGNILLRAGDICIIDWAGSEVHGYGVYDLIRAADSLRLRKREVRRQLARHAEILGGAPALQMHLLGALGHYAANPGEFPLSQLISTTVRCWSVLAAASE